MANKKKSNTKMNKTKGRSKGKRTMKSKVKSTARKLNPKNLFRDMKEMQEDG